MRTAGRGGKLNKKIVVYSDDPATPRFTLSLEGEVIVDVAASPRKIAFGSLRRGERAKKTFTLKVRDPSEVRIKSVSIEDERFKLTRTEGDDAESTYEVEFLGSGVYERIHAKVHVAVAGGTAKDLFLALYASVESDLRFPARVYFSDHKGSFRERHITFSRHSREPVEILGFKDPAGLLSCEIAANKEPRAKLVCKVKEDKIKDKSPKGHKLTVSTRDKERPKVEIDYFLTRRGPILQEGGAQRKPATLVQSKDK